MNTDLLTNQKEPYGSYLKALRDDNPGEHRDNVIKNGTAICNYLFAEKFGLPELHKEAIESSNDKTAKKLFNNTFGGI